MDFASGTWRKLPVSSSGGTAPSRPPASPMTKAAPIARLFLPAQAARTHLCSQRLRAFTSVGQDPSSLGRLDSWTLTLERGIGKAYGAEAELQATGAFRAEVFPDLPIATTWQNLAKALNGGLGASATVDPAPPFTHYTTRPGALKVITTAANLRSEYEIECRIVAAAGSGVEAIGGQRANVLLCVSGSHPVRTLPLVSRFLRSSLDTLRLAQKLRERGYLPPHTQLWVVANPNTERTAALLEAKAALGASAVLTQPPLDWGAYLTWLTDAERRGLLRPTPPASAGNSSKSSFEANDSTSSDAKELRRHTRSVDGSEEGDSAGVTDAGGLSLLVGHPVLSSAASLSFWISLCGCGSAPAVQALLGEALNAELEGKDTAARYFEAYNRRLVQQVLASGGMGGMHIMAITKASKRMVLGMLADASLPASAH